MNTNSLTPKDSEKKQWSDYILPFFLIVAIFLPFLAKYSIGV